jgi:hypothetical protein
MVKMAILAPNPRANVSTAIIVNPGFLRKRRRAYPISCIRVLITQVRTAYRSSTLLLTEYILQKTSWFQKDLAEPLKGRIPEMGIEKLNNSNVGSRLCGINFSRCMSKSVLHKLHCDLTILKYLCLIWCTSTFAAWDIALEVDSHAGFSSHNTHQSSFYNLHDWEHR